MVAATVLAAQSLCAQTPEWIWDKAKAGTNEVRFFRKPFKVTQAPDKAILTFAADDEADVWFNGGRSAGVKGWKNAGQMDVSRNMRKPGDYLIAIRGKNETDVGGVIARLELTYKDKKEFIVTDTSWLVSANGDKNWERQEFAPGDDWKPAVSLGKLGDAPWGETLKEPKATPAETLTLLPGFKAELLRSAPPDEGSWICMTVDPKGRFIISPQQGEIPLLRMTVAGNQVAKVEPLGVSLRNAMGLLYAHNSLYVNCQGPDGMGLYRLVDKNKNDQFEENEIQLMSKFDGKGEHGYHAVVLGPDNMIYVMNGNHTKLPEALSPLSPHKNYAEDLLLPRMWDAGGHAVGVMAPGGYVARTDPEGKQWEVLLAGFRNSYDFDFNADGEMFTYDSDMEWDWGAPWYRPTRINHCVIGGEYGWRSGSGKWPEYYPDSLPANVNTGIGSPTGVKFGTNSRFPEKYKRAMFALDWSYGRILAVHLKPDGATYSGTYETFLKGKPLNVSDIEFGKDGAMYFITGGRNTQSGLYRVTYTGPKIKEPKKSREELQSERVAKTAREVRRSLETFHGRSVPGAVDAVWAFLGNDDRWIRYAARIALESQDVSLWRDRALAESRPDAGLTALLALTRVDGKESQPALLRALAKFPLDSLTEEQKLAKLRVIQLSFIRQGRPEPALAQMAIEKLSRQYPASSEALNRELSQLLIFLEAPDVVARTMALLDAAVTQEEQLHYIFHLRTVKKGWTPELRRKYFEWLAAKPTDAKHPPQLIRWFEEVDREYSDGSSYAKFLVNIRKEASETLTESERLALGDLVADKTETAAAKKPAKERKFVKEWAMSDIEPLLGQVSKGRNFESGKAAFNDAQCLSCHRFGNEGGSVGPELTAASSKYSRRDILEAILEPSKVISEQYQNETVVKKDGDDVTGRVVDETPEKIVLQPNLLSAERIEIKRADIESRRPATLSPMPDGLVNILTDKEILDLLAYIESAGKASAANFGK